MTSQRMPTASKELCPTYLSSHMLLCLSLEHEQKRAVGMQNKIRFANTFFAALLLSLTPAVLRPQAPAKEQGVPPPEAKPLQTSTTTINSGIVQESARVYGIQGVLIETLDGKIVSEQAAGESFNPASSVKLATALVALHTLGPNHRFTTGFWTDGSFDKATGQVLGNLYVTGSDPSFHHEHAIMIAQQLNSLGIGTV